MFVILCFDLNLKFKILFREFKSLLFLIFIQVKLINFLVFQK